MARSVSIREHFLAVGLSQQAAAAVSDDHRDQAKVLYARALAVVGPSTPANRELIAEIKKALTDLETAAKSKKQ